MMTSRTASATLWMPIHVAHDQFFAKETDYWTPRRSRNNFEDNRLPQSGFCIMKITIQPAIHAKFNLQYRMINSFEFVGNIFKDIQQKQTTLHFYSNSFALQTLHTNFDTCTYLQSRNFLHKYFIEVDIVFFAIFSTYLPTIVKSS